MSSRKARLVVPSSSTATVLRSARRRRASASSRSRPTAITFAIIESNSGGMPSPAARPQSTRSPGPVGSSQALDAAGRGREAERRVLGVQPRLDGVAGRRGRLALEPPAGGDVQLQLDQVQPGDRLGHGMLDLQAGVDLHEREAAMRGLVEELDRAGAAVAAGEREPPRGGPDLAPPARRSSAGLDDSSMTFWLRRWQEQSRTPTAHAAPSPSAITCTSMWRAGVTSRSMNTVSSPKASCASARALASARGKLIRARRRGGCRARRRRRPP